MKTHNFLMGPAPAVAQQPATAPKFWNVASLSEDEGEIILYGEVVSRQPVDWWTGEPVKGLFITPEGFMEDLATVKGKKKITVKLNSVGGDVYTAVAIHNALKSLNAKVNIVVEGVALSAGSIIMCAGDTVTVFPGSMVMIHNAKAGLCGYFNIRELNQCINSMDACERSISAIYNAKTGIDEDTLREMIDAETWFTGRDAIEKGFADILDDNGAEPEMSMSQDKKILYCNGIAHNIEGYHNVPGTIPVVAHATPPAVKPGVNKTQTAKAAKKEGGNTPMTIEQMRAEHPDLVAQIEQEARDSVQNQSTEAVNAERQRLAAIDSIAATIPDQNMVNEAKYGENPCTAQELCFRVMQQSAAAGQQFLAGYQQDGKASGAAAVGAAPNGGAPINKQEQDAADIQAVVNAYTAGKGGTK